MDRKHLEMMLQLAEEKKREMDSLIGYLRGQIEATGGEVTRRKSRRKTALGKSAMNVKSVLNDADTWLTPAQIHEALVKRGAEIKPAQIRNILRRYKDEYFETPAHGKWKLRGKLFDREVSFKVPVDVATSKENGEQEYSF